MYPVTPRFLAAELGQSDGGRRIREFMRDRPDLFRHRHGERWLLDEASADHVRLWGRD
jgi:hypothetical protein